MRDGGPGPELRRGRKGPLIPQQLVLLGCLSLVPSTSEAQEPALLTGHLYLVGKTDRVKAARARATENKLDYKGDGRHALIAEVRDPPPACGIKVAAHFAAQVRAHFDVAVLDQCLIHATEIDCETGYLSKYPRTFLQLKYSRAADLSVGLYSLQQTKTGTHRVDLSRSDVNWIQGLFFQIADVAEHCPE